MPRSATGTGLFIRYWLPVVVYVAIIITLSAQPNLRPPMQFQNSDKWYHVAEYFGLGIVMVRAIGASLGFHRLLTAGFLALGIGTPLVARDRRIKIPCPVYPAGRSDWHRMYDPAQRPAQACYHRIV